MRRIKKYLQIKEIISFQLIMIKVENGIKYYKIKKKVNFNLKKKGF